VLGSVYPHDVWVRSDDSVIRDVLRRARPGAIIVLHEGGGRANQPPRSRVLRVLDRILPELRAQGFTVTTVSGLLEAAERTRRGSAGYTRAEQRRS
jgi:peptidoglycan/xylan/chitin deacetylase (PgdA/CDA1 family)